MEKKVQKINLLLVDDEIDLLEAVEDYLSEEENFNVLTANSGNSAFEKLKNHDIDIIISDVRMPDGDGIELLEKAKAYRPDLPVIMVTGFSTQPKEDILEKGAQAIWNKPVNFEELIKKINELASSFSKGKTDL